MSLPTRGETFAKLIETVRLAQEYSATMAHLDGQDGYVTKARQWIQISENFKRTVQVVTDIATK